MPPSRASFESQRQRFVAACLNADGFDAKRAYTAAALTRLQPLCEALCTANAVEAVKELVLLSRYLDKQGFSPAAKQLVALGKRCLPKQAKRRHSTVASESSFS